MKKATLTTINTTKANDIGELKGLLTPARKKGLPVAIIQIPRKLFAIDKAYQTEERTERDLGYLVNDFKRVNLLPVTGVPHDEEGKIYLVDGYGRWKASEIVDKREGKNEYEYLDCMVILNAPTEPEARRRYEAEMYAFQNKSVARVTPLQKHGAFRCMNYPAALIIDKMQEKYKFELSKGSGQRSAGILGSYDAVFKMCGLHGEECADYIFNICEKSGFNIKANGYATYVIKALTDIWKFYPDNREESSKYLSEWLRQREPMAFRAKATTRYEMLDYRTACSLFLEDLLVDNMDLNHVRKVDGKSVTQLVKIA